MHRKIDVGNVPEYCHVGRNGTTLRRNAEASLNAHCLFAQATLRCCGDIPSNPPADRFGKERIASFTSASVTSGLFGKSNHLLQVDVFFNSRMASLFISAKASSVDSNCDSLTLTVDNF